MFFSWAKSRRHVSNEYVIINTPMRMTPSLIWESTRAKSRRPSSESWVPTVGVRGFTLVSGSVPIDPSFVETSMATCAFYFQPSSQSAHSFAEYWESSRNKFFFPGQGASGSGLLLAHYRYVYFKLYERIWQCVVFSVVYKSTVSPAMLPSWYRGRSHAEQGHGQVDCWLHSFRVVSAQTVQNKCVIKFSWFNLCFLRWTSDGND